MFDEQEKEALASLRYLWKSNDSVWVNERKQQWRALAKSAFSQDSAKTIKEYGRYFVYGEKGTYIDSTSLYLLTPYNSVCAAKEVFSSALFGAHERSKVFSNYLDSLVRTANAMPWLQSHSRYFVEAVMGNEYRIVKDSVDKNETISPDPSFWAKLYYVKTSKILKSEFDGEYHGYVDCMDYFVSILPFVTYSKSRKRMRWNELYEEVDAVLSNENSPELASRFARQLLDRKDEILDAWAINAEIDS